MVTQKPYGTLQGVRPGKLVDQLLEYGFPPEEIIHRLELERKVRRDRAELLVEVALRQRDLLAPLGQRAELISLYVGIPFCPSRCAYCSFTSHSLVQYGEKEREQYFSGLQEELAFLKTQALESGLKLCSAYIGGGTPTTLSTDQLKSLMSVLGDMPWWEGPRELTLEAGRPDTITIEKLRSVPRSVRIAINPQSMHEATLRAIGRSHSVADVHEAFALVHRLGFSNTNADLIIGLPSEGAAEVQQSVEQVLSLGPSSITMHMFSPKRASAYAKGAGWSPMPDDEAYLTSTLTSQKLKAAGLYPYYLYRQRGILGGLENTGWALPQQECLYNVLVIGESQTIFGAGAGASSKFVIKGQDWDHQANPKDARVYLKRLPEIMETKRVLLDKWRKSL